MRDDREKLQDMLEAKDIHSDTFGTAGHHNQQ